MLRAHLKRLLDDRAAARRSSGAAHLFHGGRVSLLDRALAALYFHVTAEDWARRIDDADYLEPLHAGLRHCRTPTRVIDIGTGAGASASAAALRFPAAEVIGIDISERMLRHARRRFEAVNLRFERASSSRLPYGDGAFDLVMWLNAMPDPLELCRVATDDAQVLGASSFTVPPDERSAWMRRWSDLGFRRLAAAPVQRGGWELFQRVPAGASGNAGGGRPSALRA